MAYKNREKSSELLTLELLNDRMELLEDDMRHFLNLKKGYLGEIEFDALTEKLQSECIILNDLLLKNKSTHFQIDSLILFQELIYLFEVKNFEGDFYYESSKFYTLNRKGVNNPLDQLNKCELNLRQLLQSLGFNVKIRSFIVFINPEFTLYQTPLNMPCIFPTQLNQFMQQLNNTRSTIKPNNKKLAEKLVAMHIQDSPFKSIPAYDYEQLRKGITCVGCRSFSIRIEGSTCTCNSCGRNEKFSNAVVRSVNEYKLLFPEKKITTNTIYEWCKIVDSKQRIKRALQKNLIKKGNNHGTYYE
ncbi:MULTISPECIES: nuclease-related domain-containing protein [Bacillus]|uniref:nuclease-related domain-containing protein n=1 Tax=Bacillus TaxID=1386 RepID=UPI000BB784F4|nr:MULTISPECIES: nuclease-related domain-containing protein [Bacillus]